MSGTLGLAPGTVKSLNDNFLLPHVSFSRKIDDKSALGLILYGNGGLNTTYPGGGPGTGTFFAGPTGVNLVQIFIAPTYARSFGKRFAAGASLTGSSITAGWSTSLRSPPGTRRLRRVRMVVEEKSALRC